MDPVTLRALERLMVVAVDGLSVWLGYRLFLRMPQQQDSEGRVSLPGGISVYMSRVGPGAFFALFGAATVSFSFHSTVSYTETRPAAGPAAPSDTSVAAVSRNFSGLQNGPLADEALDSQLDCLQKRADLHFLEHTLPTVLAPGLAENRRNQVDRVISRMKRAATGTCGGPSPAAGTMQP